MQNKANDPTGRKAYIITGPTSGIGLATAFEVAKHVTVVPAGRDRAKLMPNCPGIEAGDLLRAVATLCRVPRDKEPVYARKMVDLLVDGLRYGAKRKISEPFLLE